jgi:ABC-type antimicrobial peptide transport system permease subunit
MAIGGIASMVLRRALGASITDVPLSDPASGVALMLFALVGLAACLVPGVRATRLDPVRSLHQE